MIFVFYLSIEEELSIRSVHVVYTAIELISVLVIVSRIFLMLRIRLF